MQKLTEKEISTIVQKAAKMRLWLTDDSHQTAFRVFSGFYEGLSEIVADVYASTLVLFSYCEVEEDSYYYTQIVRDVLLECMPWIHCVIVKHHHATHADLRKGEITYGSNPDIKVVENGISYSVDLTLNQDASFYLDTINLRKWLLMHAKGCDVLNFFAYTGSLGIAALAGGANQVVQIDRNRRFLEIARQSAMLNRLDLGRMKLKAVDFFVETGQLKRSGRLFDLIIVDPPFFSITERGMVNQVSESHRIINKIRPLVKDGGRIVAINNALFLSGDEYYEGIKVLCRDGFLSIEEIIPVPQEITGYPETIMKLPVVPSEPFNHSTKMMVLKVKKKL